MWSSLGSTYRTMVMKIWGSCSPFISSDIVFFIASISEASYAFYGANGGDYDWDPLGIASGDGPLPPTLRNVGRPEALALAEIKNGRLAMLAVAGFVAQENALGSAVVEQTPWFFGRM